MAIGATIVGALIGAVVGVVFHIGLEFATDFGELPWFSVVTGLAVGLGVRVGNGKAAMNRVSYLRGAVAAAIALVAIVVSPQIKALLIQSQTGKTTSQVANVNRQLDEETDDESSESSGERTGLTDGRENGRIPSGLTSGIGKVGVQSGFDTLQFIYIAVGTFLAYEFARGRNGTTPVGTASEESGKEEPPSVPSEEPKAEN